MMKSEHIFGRKATDLRTRRARGGFELSRTLGLRGDSARLAASLHSAPKTKKFSLKLLLRWRGLGRSRQKMERKILWCSALKVSGRWRGEMWCSDGAGGGGWGEESRAVLAQFFLVAAVVIDIRKVGV